MGCLFETSFAKLKETAGPNCIPLRLDVGNEADVAIALRDIEKECGSDGLWACMNNAGIGPGSLIEWNPNADFRNIMYDNATVCLAAPQLNLYPQAS